MSEGGAGIDLKEVRRLLAIWGLWQSSIEIHRLGDKRDLSYGAIGGVAEFDSDEADWVEKMVLKLKAINKEAARALTVYYVNPELELTGVACICNCSLATVKNRIGVGEHFIAGVLSMRMNENA